MLQEGRKDDSERKTRITQGRGWANGHHATLAILGGLCKVQRKKIEIALYLGIL